MGLGKCYLPRCWKIGCAMRSESRLPGEDGICGIRKGVEACYSVAEWLGNSEEAVLRNLGVTRKAAQSPGSTKFYLSSSYFASR